MSVPGNERGNVRLRSMFSIALSRKLFDMSRVKRRRPPIVAATGAQQAGF
jgi:hypothetical protein